MIYHRYKVISLFVISWTIISLQAHQSSMLCKSHKVKTKDLKKSVKLFKNRVNPTCPDLPPPSGPNEPIQNPNAPAVTFFPNNSVTNSPLLPPQTLGVTYDIGPNQVTPYVQPFNPSAVAGIEQILFASSFSLISFDRRLVPDGILESDPTTFCNLDGNFTFFSSEEEIEMRYDKFADRFYFAADNFSELEFISEEAGGVVFGVSDSGIITDDSEWTIVSIFSGNLIPDPLGCGGEGGTESSFGTSYDYCRAGVDQHAYYFAFDIFGYPLMSLQATSAFVIQKESLLKGGPAVVTAFREVSGNYNNQNPYRYIASTVIPVMNFDANSEFGYFISQDPVYWGRLLLFRVINPGSKTPTLSAAIPIDVPTTGMVTTVGAPFLGNQYGYLGAINALDDRLKMAHIRNKQLFTTHNLLVDSTGVSSVNGDRLGIRWYQIDLTGDSTGNARGIETATTVPQLVQAGTLFDPSAVDPIWYYQPAIMTNKRGDMSLSGVLSGNTQSISAFNVGRLASDPLGVLRMGSTPAQIIIAPGSGTYTDRLGQAGENQRIADRVYTCFDPVDDMTMWACQQFIQDGYLYCRLAQLIAPTL